MEFIKSSGKTNTVFVGSSKVKTQIVPQVFDSTLNKTTASFNLGCNGLFIPEAFNVLDYLLDSSNVKTIFFELRPVYHIYKENLHITRTIYYHTVSSYLKTIDITMHSNLPIARKLSAYFTYSIAGVENLINFNLTEGLIKYRNDQLQSLSSQYKYNLGFFPMGNGPGEALLDSHDELAERTLVAKRYMELNSAGGASWPLNKAYLDEVQRIAEKAKSKHVQLVLIFPPALREFEYKEILPMLKNLSFLPQLNMADPKMYPELYEVKNNFETDHLNAEGAKLYSIDLGNALKKTISGN